MSNQVKKIGFTSIAYHNSKIYNWLTRFLYDQKKKFLSIATLIGNSSKKVLDVPCGTGYLARFLDPSTRYVGIDLNLKFLKGIEKDWNKGKINLRNVSVRQDNIFNTDSYENCDVIVLCDILHHVFPDHKKLVDIAKKYARKVIICEPKVVKPQDNMNGHDFLAKCVIKISKIFPEKLMRYLDFFFGDNDGINSYEKRNLWKHDEESLTRLYNEMDFYKIYNLMDDYIGVWER